MNKDELLGIEPPGVLSIVSFPKSGRTWLRVILCRAFAKQFKLTSLEKCLDLRQITHAAGLPTVSFTHDDAASTHPYYRLKRNRSEYAGSRVVMLLRDPRDTLVSYYFHRTKRFGATWDKNISEFVRSPVFGIRKIISYHQIWWASRCVPRVFDTVLYEDLHKHTLATVQSLLLCLMQAPVIDNQVLSEAIQFATFENMRALESQNWFGNKVLRPANPNDLESFKTRRGVVGGYRDYLCEADVDYIEGMIRKARCPLLDLYL